MRVMRQVVVKPVLNGFIVEVGCQTVVFNRIEDVAANLIAYQKDPEGTEKQFAANAVNKTLGGGPVPECLDPPTESKQTEILHPTYYQ